MPKQVTGKKFAKRVQKAVATKYGIKPKDVAESFSLTPTQTQTLNTEVSRGSGFLSLVNVEQRSQKKGQTLRIGRQGPSTKTNNTKGGDSRRPASPRDPHSNEYEMHKTHTDYSMHDDDVSDWSEFPDWAKKYKQAFNETINEDRQIIGFHGTEHVTTSDLTNKPLMQDVNKGWIQLGVERVSANINTGDDNGVIKIGTKEGDNFANLDEMVHDTYTAIPMHKRTAGMVAIIGEGLLAAAEGRLYAAQGETPTEKRAMQVKQVIGTYGGLPAITASYFPENAIMITTLKINGNSRSNLTLHNQRGTWKRHIQYVPADEATVDWNARWEGYHIDDLGKFAMAKPEIVLISATGQEITAVPENRWDDPSYVEPEPVV